MVFGGVNIFCHHLDKINLTLLTNTKIPCRCRILFLYVFVISSFSINNGDSLYGINLCFTFLIFRFLAKVFISFKKTICKKKEKYKIPYYSTKLERFLFNRFIFSIVCIGTPFIVFSVLVLQTCSLNFSLFFLFKSIETVYGPISQNVSHIFMNFLL